MHKFNVEKYLHFLSCIQSIERAKSTFKQVKLYKDHPLSESAFGYALIQYSHPYKESRINKNNRLKLGTAYIPEQYTELHRQLDHYRDTLHAHRDQSSIDTTLYGIEKINGLTYTLTSSNVDIRFEMMSKIEEILSMIDGTLENMYVQKEKYEKLFLQINDSE